MFSYASPDSLGAISFEMLTGRPPFSGATLAELIHAVVHEPPPYSRDHPPCARSIVWSDGRSRRRHPTDT
jgi:serine/threonine protein kinase